MSGGGSEGDGGVDVEWLGEAMRVVGVDEALRAVRAEAGWAYIGSIQYLTRKPEPRAARWGQWQRSESEGGERWGQ